MPHLNDIFRTALRVTGERGAAEDVIQEVYLQAWRSFDRFESGHQLPGMAVQDPVPLRQPSPAQVVPLPAAEGDGGVSGGEPGAARSPMPQHLTDGEILAALDGIAAEFRSVVLLVDVEEFAYKEVAEILGDSDRDRDVAPEPRPSDAAQAARGRGAVVRNSKGRCRGYELMTVTNFDEWACRHARTRLDSYIDSELLVETNLEMEHHFERCRDCAREAETRRELRARVRTAARQAPVPRGSRRESATGCARERPSRTRWNLMAVAAAILACVAGWVGYQRAGFARRRNSRPYCRSARATTCTAP